MAKASATCTCATCGNEFTVTKIKRNRAEAYFRGKEHQEFHIGG